MIRKEPIMLNVIAVVFANESEGYQAITALRNTQVSEQMAIIERYEK